MKIARIKNKLPQLAVLLVILIAIGVRTEHNKKSRAQSATLPSKELLACIKQALPTTESIEEVAPETWTVVGRGHEEIGQAILAQKTTSDIIGYSGPTPLVVVVNDQEQVECIALLPNDETPSYVGRVVEEGFLKRWKGMPVEEAVSKDMDAISGATYSSVAINETVKKRLSEYAQAASVARKADLKAIVGYVAVLFVLLYALAFYFYPQRFNKYRISLLILSIGVLGFFYGSFLSVKLVGSWLMQGISLKNQVIFVTIALLAFVLPYFFGKNFYCSYVCPFGASQELLGKLSKRKVELPSLVVSVLSRTRSKVLLLLMAITLFGSTLEISDAEPFSIFLFASASKGVVVLAVLFLLLSVAIPRAWCRYFCPTGALIDFFRRESKDVLPKSVTPKVQLIALLVAVLFVLAVFGAALFTSF